MPFDLSETMIFNQVRGLLLRAELMYSSYRHQRLSFPETAPVRWRAVYEQWQQFEVRFQWEENRCARRVGGHLVCMNSV